MIDPIGTVPVFIVVTQGYEPRLLRMIAFKSSLVALMVLVGFVVVGELALNAMHVPLSAFQIAGGSVLFLFALSMIFGESKPDEEVRLAADAHETAVFPLAIPSIAGPGAMLAAVLLTKNDTYSISEQAVTVGAITCVVVLTFILMLVASPINRIIGRAGASIISRVMGIVLTAVAVTNVLGGVTAYFKL